MSYVAAASFADARAPRARRSRMSWRRCDSSAAFRDASMAKLGEGDARWIVDERADGANVNGWHCASRDAMRCARLGCRRGGLGLARSGGRCEKMGEEDC